MRTLECPRLLSMAQAESGSWTPTGQHASSNEQHATPSGYYTSACSVTTAVMADPFIS